MPSTITTYFTFQAATPAKSSEVNNNFSNYRGNLLPINENTTTASNLTHYVGLADHIWAGGYFETMNFGNSSSAWLVSQNVSTAAFEFSYNGTLAGAIPITGSPVLTEARGFGATTSALVGGIAASAILDKATDTGLAFQTLSGSTITLVTTGRPVMLMLVGSTSGVLGHFNFVGAAARLGFYRGTTQVLNIVYNSVGGTRQYPGFSHIDRPAAGTQSYSIGWATSDVADRMGNMGLIAFEL